MELIFLQWTACQTRASLSFHQTRATATATHQTMNSTSALEEHQASFLCSPEAHKGAWERRTVFRPQCQIRGLNNQWPGWTGPRQLISSKEDTVHLVKVLLIQWSSCKLHSITLVGSNQYAHSYFQGRNRSSKNSFVWSKCWSWNQCAWFFVLSIYSECHSQCPVLASRGETQYLSIELQASNKREHFRKRRRRSRIWWFGLFSW